MIWELWSEIMPLYDFFCEKCGEIIEELQKVGESPPKCPNDNEVMKKKLSTFSLRKGGGLYSLDTTTKRWDDLE